MLDASIILQQYNVKAWILNCGENKLHLIDLAVEADELQEGANEIPSACWQ